MGTRIALSTTPPSRRRASAASPKATGWSSTSCRVRRGLPRKTSSRSSKPHQPEHNDGPLARAARFVCLCVERAAALPARAAQIRVDVVGEHIERHVAALHHGVVESLQVIACPEARPRLLALAVDLAVAHLVAAGLSRPRAIAVHL